MIELMPTLPNNVVGFVIRGEATASDYETVLIPEVESRLQNLKKIRIFCHLGADFSGFSAAAMWDDLKIGIKHLTVWEKIVIVTDKDWIKTGINTFDNVIPCPIKVFDNEHLEQAKIWISA